MIFSCGIVPTLNCSSVALVAEQLVLEEDLLGDLLGAADEVRAAQRRATRRTARGVSGGQPRSRPMRAHHVGVRAGTIVGGLLRVVGDVAVRVDADRQLGSWPAAADRLAVEIDERREALGLAADDRQRHRQAEHAGADDRLRVAADGDPDRQRVLHRARVDALRRRAPARCRPCQVTTSRSRSFEQQLELLGEQLVVVARGRSRRAGTTR